MNNTLDLDLAHCGAGERRKHDPSKRIAQGCAVSALKRLHDELTVTFVLRHLGNLDLWFVKIEHVCPSLWVDGSVIGK